MIDKFYNMMERIFIYATSIDDGLTEELKRKGSRKLTNEWLAMTAVCGAIILFVAWW